MADLAVGVNQARSLDVVPSGVGVKVVEGEVGPMPIMKGSLMEPGRPTSGEGLGGLRLDLLRQAVEIYLSYAYGGRDLPESVSRRLTWREGCSTQELLERPPFERAGKALDQETPIFALRLGNARYPHMKLQIQPWPNEAGFMLSVNTHDQVSGIDLGAEAESFRALQAENQRLKEAIEKAWEDAGLPTFLRYLRDYISRQAEGGIPEETDPPAAGSN